jgi:hypothetical protein
VEIFYGPLGEVTRITAVLPTRAFRSVAKDLIIQIQDPPVRHVRWPFRRIIGQLHWLVSGSAQSGHPGSWLHHNGWLRSALSPQGSPRSQHACGLFTATSLLQKDLANSLFRSCTCRKPHLLISRGTPWVPAQPKFRNEGLFCPRSYCFL